MSPPESSSGATAQEGADLTKHNGNGRRPGWRALWRMGRRRWLYLPRLFSRRERIVLASFGIVALAAFSVFTGRLITRITVAVPAVGGMLREGALHEPRFINPLWASADTDRDLTELVFAKLIRYDRLGAVVMDLAEDVELSPDGKAYTARLRDGLRWHDGETLDADDVIFTVKAIQDPEYRSALRPNWQGVAAEKLNDRTVRFTLRQPYAPFLENMAIGILPEHLWRKIPRETAILSDLNLKPIGSGPYRFEKFTRREDGTITSLTLVRNTRYHLPGPYLKQIRFSFYPNEAERVAAYRRNDIDSFVLSSPAQEEALASLDIEFHELALPKVFAVFLNGNAESALGRPAVRKALSSAIDRERLLRETLGGAGTLADSPIPQGTFGFNGDIAAVSYDPARAKNLLQEDGWKARNADGVLERSEGRGAARKVETLELTLVTSDAPELASAAGLIAEMWRAIGVATEVRIMAISDLEASVIRPRAYEALLFGEVFGHDPDPFAFWHTSQLKDPGLNIAMYSNRRVDELLEEARRTHDAASREEKYREFQKIVADELGLVALYSPSQTYAVRKSIRGVAIGDIALPEERFSEVHGWYMDTRRALK